MNTVKEARLSNRGASHVQSEVFWAIKKLASQVNCPVLNRVADGDIYRRSNTPMKGLGDELVGGRIVFVNFEKRDRIVQLISDSLKSPCPFKMTLDQYDMMRELTSLYQLLAGKHRLHLRVEHRVREVINDVCPGFYTSNEFEL